MSDNGYGGASGQFGSGPNPLDFEGLEAAVAFCKPVLRISHPQGVPTHRISFEVSEELFDMFKNARKLNKMMLGGTLQVLNYDVHDPTGGYFSNRAAMLCKDPRFWLYLSERSPDGRQYDESMAVKWVRHNCKVTSRAELDHNDEARKRFVKICRLFTDWCAERRYPATYLGAVADS